ncbi:MAG: hypothetical protein D6718_12225 [Acidobacteria bacterium]|nr:MAG: hypothetical protein D6718_12225 [Acidobacteriota bacterium]
MVDAPGPRPGRWTAVFFLTLFIVNAAGLPYYLAPLPVRVRSPLHPIFKPNGYVGHTAGVAALVLFLFLWVYPLRKRIPWLSRAGSMRVWLHLHIVAGLAMPLLAATHAAWRFTGVIGLGFWASCVVAASGMVGRYLYVRVPRSRQGLELSIGEIEARSRRLVSRIAARTTLSEERIRSLLATSRPAASPSLPHALFRLFADDLERRRAVRRLMREVRKKGSGTRLERRALARVRRLARRRVALEQQAKLLEATQRLFRYWHTAHMPVAITALITVLVHVAVVVALGTTWFW